MFTSMVATAFDLDAPLDQRRAIIRRDGDDVEMVELPWGLQPREPGGRPFTVIRAEGRTFPSHRCLVPASEFRHRSRGRQYTFSLANCDWFYFAGIWRPATRDWPESYAILTIEANADIAPYHDRQMAVLKRDQINARPVETDAPSKHCDTERGRDDQPPVIEPGRRPQCVAGVAARIHAADLDCFAAISLAVFGHDAPNRSDSSYRGTGSSANVAAPC